MAHGLPPEENKLLIEQFDTSDGNSSRFYRLYWAVGYSIAMRRFEGTMHAHGFRFAIVVSRYNEVITERLREGAIQTLLRYGADTNQIDVYTVPGSWEIPLLAGWCAKSGRYDAVICLGAVLQGETQHAQHISGSVCSALMQIMRETGVPVTLGVLTDATFEQALERAGGKVGNKGAEAALSAIEMVNLLNTLAGGEP